MTTDKRDEEAPPVWRTKEMALAAYLKCLGHRYVRMEIDESNHPVSCFWVFEETDELTDEVFKYLEGDGLVEPKGFNNNVAQLKNGMFDYLRSQGVLPNRR